VHISGQTRIVEVLFEAGEPRLAADFANSLVNEYIAASLANRVGGMQQTGELLAGQLKDLKSEVVNSEQRLQEYALRSGLVYISDKDNAAEARLRQLQASLSAAQDARAAEQSKYEMAVNSPADSLPDVLDSQTLRSYQVNLTDLRRQLADLSAVLTPTHYKVQQLKAQITELQNAADRERANIQGRIKNQYQAAARRQTLIEDDYANQMRLAATQAAKSVRYDSLKREVDMHRLLYEATLQKVKEASVASAIRANNVRVLDPANPPRVPIRPNRAMNAAVGMIAGTFFGLGFVLFRQRTDRPIRIPADARIQLQMPELGAIPSGAIALRHPFRQDSRFMPGQRSNGFGAAHGNGNAPGNWLELATWQQRDSALAESFRGTLASLLFSTKNGSTPRVIVITSASAGEGKTTVTTNLGIALAATNHRVLLIDGNRRNPRLHDIFGLSGSWGFSNLLQSFTPCDEYASEDLSLETEIPGLCVLPSGSDSSSIPNLLYDRRTAELIARLRSEFDAILIDTPPVLTHADARALGRLADGAALVIRAGQTPLDSALSAWMRLNEDGVNGLGTILNDCRAGAKS
ncbi:MAG: polysaccharide biosynthesis tyrosine autokinase, partial [Acidobacteriota bacterium]|nr:polysaccharide biosynthesis tyrosine autokinase [Acidobacteriota bacterium]